VRDNISLDDPAARQRHKCIHADVQDFADGHRFRVENLFKTYRTDKASLNNDGGGDYPAARKKA
jgi:hypothetical protein